MPTPKDNLRPSIISTPEYPAIAPDSAVVTISAATADVAAAARSDPDHLPCYIGRSRTGRSYCRRPCQEHIFSFPGRKKKRETQMMCRTCRVPLCLECYVPFHNKLEL